MPNTNGLTLPQLFATAEGDTALVTIPTATTSLVFGWVLTVDRLNRELSALAYLRHLGLL